MPTLSQCIKDWFDRDDYPPRSTNLPGTIEVDGCLLASINNALKRSIEAGKEIGAGIGYWELNGKPPLELGKEVIGAEDSIFTYSQYTPMGSAPVGTYHTHPEGFYAPSPGDIWALLATEERFEIFELVVTGGGRFYLLVRTIDVEKIGDRTSFDQSIEDLTRSTIQRVRLETWKEIKEFQKSGHVPLDYGVDPFAVNQISYELSVAEFATRIKMGFYSGESAVMRRR